MNKDIAISVQGVSKTFKIPHEKVSSIRGAVTGIFWDKSYEEFKVYPVAIVNVTGTLDDVSFEVKKGEFFGEEKTLAEACFEALENDDNSYNIKVLKTPALTIFGTAGFRF